MRIIQNCPIVQLSTPKLDPLGQYLLFRKNLLCIVQTRVLSAALLCATLAAMANARDVISIYLSIYLVEGQAIGNAGVHGRSTATPGFEGPSCRMPQLSGPGSGTTPRPTACAPARLHPPAACRAFPVNLRHPSLRSRRAGSSATPPHLPPWERPRCQTSQACRAAPALASPCLSSASRKLAGPAVGAARLEAHCLSSRSAPV